MKLRNSFLAILLVSLAACTTAQRKDALTVAEDVGEVAVAVVVTAAVIEAPPEPTCVRYDFYENCMEWDNHNDHEHANHNEHKGN